MSEHTLTQHRLCLTIYARRRGKSCRRGGLISVRRDEANKYVQCGSGDAGTDGVINRYNRRNLALL
jgi:hypothetical protein